MSTNAAVPERILEEAYRLAKESIFHGGVDWAAGDIAKALAAAEQRGREEAASFADQLAAGFDVVSQNPSKTDDEAGLLRVHARAFADFATAIRSRSEGKGE